MPRDLFAAPTMTTVRSARRRFTIVCSTVAHVGVVALIVILPLVSGLSLPELSHDLYYVKVIAAPPDPPPPPKPLALVKPTTSTLPDPGVAPTVQPQGFAPDREPAAPASQGVVPGVLNVASGDFLIGAANAGSAPMLGKPPAPSRPLPVGGDIHAPQRTFFVDPIYPEIAQAAHVEGVVILEATIDERGNVVNTRVLRSVGLLDKAAIDAVGRWRYTPTKLNGVPVAVIMTVTVTFSMR